MLKTLHGLLGELITCLICCLIFKEWHRHLTITWLCPWQFKMCISDLNEGIYSHMSFRLKKKILLKQFYVGCCLLRFDSWTPPANPSQEEPQWTRRMTRTIC